MDFILKKFNQFAKIEQYAEKISSKIHLQDLFARIRQTFLTKTAYETASSL